MISILLSLSLSFQNFSLMKKENKKERREINVSLSSFSEVEYIFFLKYILIIMEGNDKAWMENS